ncbi:hypothetical protein MA16_Dca016293 [Dendrobium catenatum]|uniref:Uncharacterized protein n=1 Tax=Dendrobium catenatum TaxID=906689 RepID=A0A2I0W871_9ASPA|nr:hypothetical protein MA16_Dca016293 [Dendrobium catenatum]
MYNPKKRKENQTDSLYGRDLVLAKMILDRDSTSPLVSCRPSESRWQASSSSTAQKHAKPKPKKHRQQQKDNNEATRHSHNTKRSGSKKLPPVSPGTRIPQNKHENLMN